MKLYFNLKIFLIILPFLYCCNSALSNENRIDAIKILGNQRIDVETVIAYSKVNVGDAYDEEAW